MPTHTQHRGRERRWMGFPAKKTFYRESFLSEDTNLLRRHIWEPYDGNPTHSFLNIAQLPISLIS